MVSQPDTVVAPIEAAVAGSAASCQHRLVDLGRVCEPSAVTLLAAKILLAPLCVVAISLAGRRWGVAFAGVLGGLPAVAGPILLVETLLHGRGFGAEAAAGTLLGIAAVTTFVIVYGRVAVASGPIPSVLLGWAAFLVCVAALSLIHPPPALSLAVVAVCLSLGLRVVPSARSGTPAAGAPPWWDLPARACGALSLVLALTAVSGALGAHLSGLLAPFPVLTSVLAVFTQAQGGQVEILLRSFLFGFYGFAAFSFTLAVALPHLTTVAAFGAATAVAIVVQAAAFVLRSQLADRRDLATAAR